MRAGKESRAPQSCEERQYGLVNPPIAVDGPVPQGQGQLPLLNVIR